MSFFEDDEEEQLQEDLTVPRRRPGPRSQRGSGRRRGPRNRGPRGRSPLPRVLVILAAVVVLVLIASIGIKSCIDQRTVSEYRDYFNAVGSITKDSDAIGQQLSGIFQNPSPQVRQSLEAKLGDFQKASNQILARAKAINPPDAFKQENNWFVASMQFRVRGLNGLQPAMLNALGAQDNNAGAAQISHEMLILLAGDVVYDEFFYQPCQKELGQEQISNIKVPESKFLEDAELAGQETGVAVLEKLKGGPTAQVTGLHGVALVGVKAEPSGNPLHPSSQNNLKAAGSLTFQVEVENQGEATETNVPVSITLTAPSRPNPQKIEGQIPSIAPNERKTIDLSGLAADPSSEVTILSVSCGPVPGEKNLQNNSAQYKVVFG